MILVKGVSAIIPRILPSLSCHQGTGGENRLRIRNNQDLGVVHLLSPSGDLGIGMV